MVGAQIRDAFAGLLNKAIAGEIEAKLFERCGKQYNAQARAVLINLRDPHNPDLKARVLAGAITPDQLSVATSDVCFSLSLLLLQAGPVLLPL